MLTAPFNKCWQPLINQLKHNILEVSILASLRIKKESMVEFEVKIDEYMPPRSNSFLREKNEHVSEMSSTSIGQLFISTFLDCFIVGLNFYNFATSFLLQ
jgi:hypothetical protein